MNTSMRLTLSEKLMLLMLDEQSGKLHPWVYSHGLYLGAAILTDLLLWDRIRLTKGKKPTVDIQSREPTGSPLHDQWLERIHLSPKLRPVGYWLQKLFADTKLASQVADALIAKGLIKRERHPYLWIFRRTLYPTLNPMPRQRLIQGLRRTMIGNERHLPTDTRVLIHLGQHCGLWRAVFGKRFVRTHKERLRDIAQQKVGGTNLMKLLETQTALNQIYTNIRLISGSY